MKCGVCGEEVTDNPAIAFRSFDGSYPVAWRTNMLFAHDTCTTGQDWYVISGWRFSYDQATEWISHLGSKRWFTPYMVEPLRALCAEAYSVLITNKMCRNAEVGVRWDARHINGGTRARIMERDGFKCRRCGVGPHIRALVVDHVYPVAAGGTREEGNLQTLCTLCNSGKRDRAPVPHDGAPAGSSR